MKIKHEVEGWILSGCCHGDHLHESSDVIIDYYTKKWKVKDREEFYFERDGEATQFLFHLDEVVAQKVTRFHVDEVDLTFVADNKWKIVCCDVEDCYIDVTCTFKDEIRKALS